MSQLRFTAFQADVCDTCAGDLPEPEPSDPYDDRAVRTRNNGDRAHVGCALGPSKREERPRGTDA